MNYQKYSPKRPIKSFQDLEVYQTVVNGAAEIFNRCREDMAAKTTEAVTESQSKAPLAVEEDELITELKGKIRRNLLECVLALPGQIARAHSLRFSELAQALRLLDEAMLQCNCAVVYLEQYRDLANHKVELEFFERQARKYLTVRWKIMHLLRSWQKFAEIQKP
ncbi:hypothetical protein COS81_03855 [candidate division WWE3 bacterium CG06_land_8_20_14_3_00_42_16]|uniref:Four helix bundle protein n=3 Tax=Katanobacteria TaxID=422282 RepID=A0A2M7AM69_UNCKA|nr:MAG: hypothetical protein AUJ38_00115 [bacterium CG1_02_42_9]PIU68473.1 MAG: hypothetical protein COS81_03855 [candidate division WWE3 bacterium CG06_land_8_20_14_3_00_42_16]PIZ42938.1 MAG: hypothetical protein COY34_01885 [candidate division WWE3 bacterium CG_4_10_14_0_2_um_filter_42_8]PJA38062.1 MAG: hypothetical protein CO181_01220 [candidate division WWE3 bacterium CG_4_9_14_3_um_filter_43_9]